MGSPRKPLFLWSIIMGEELEVEVDSLYTPVNTGLEELVSRTQGTELEDSKSWTQGLKELDSRTQ